MTKNIGKKDRIIRFVFFIVLALLAILLEGLFLKTILGLLAIFNLFQVLSSWCLFYKIIGKNTCPID